MNSVKQILVINDEPDMLAQIRRWLKAAGYSVKCTLWGKAGVELAKSNLYDLILLDYNLKKEEDGEKTAGNFIPLLRGINPFTPIVVTSATEKNITAHGLGVVDVIIVDSSFWSKLINYINVLFS